MAEVDHEAKQKVYAFVVCPSCGEEFAPTYKQCWSMAHRGFRAYCSLRCCHRGFAQRVPKSGADVASYKHGYSGSATYYIWANMRRRCTRSDHKSYSLYGGRGIRVCDRWQRSFVAFLEDMGERPPGMTLERIDNNSHYTPENCRWATPKEQANNRRPRQGGLTYDGRTQTIRDWGKETGISEDCIRRRLAKGWAIEKALTVPQTHRPRDAAFAVLRQQMVACHDGQGLGLPSPRSPEEQEALGDE